MNRYKMAFSYFRRHKFTQNDRRNFRLGGVVSAYGISFAIEKFFLGYMTPLSDKVWFWVYGLFAVICTFWWLEDFLLDIWEENTTEDDEIYKNNS